jgi:glucose/arabinose dehydrogenase
VFTLHQQWTAKAIKDAQQARESTCHAGWCRSLTTTLPYGLLLVIAALHGTAANSATIQTRRAATGFTGSLFGSSPAGDNRRMFVLEKNTGQIRILNLSTGTILPTPFLTVPGISTTSEQGLLGMAFDPNYTSNGFFYVNYTDTTGATNVARYQVSANPNVANAGSAQPIIKYSQPQANHNGGWLGFGPNDGYLYISSGDGGGGNDSGTGHAANGNAQTISNNLLGKMLRIDVHADDFPSDSAKNYAIPASNPFVGVTGDDEIWAYGLRNPWRPSFDRETGDLYIADVGQGVREEINFQPASSPGGENYGWRLREGTIATPTVGGPAPPGAIEPIYDYEHGSGATQGDSVTGGYVYRGPVLDIQGKYFFGDFIQSRVWSIEHNGTADTEFINWNAMASFAPNAGSINQIASFAEDNLGRLYIIGFDGEVFRVTSDAFTVLPTGTNVSGQVSGGPAVVGGTAVTFDNITLSEEFGSQYVVEPISSLDAGIAASINFPLASDPVQRWQVDFFGEFTGNATLTFHYDDLNLLVPESELNIYHLVNDNWELLPVVSRDALGNLITVTTDSFSPFLLGGTLSASAGIVPEPGTLLGVCCCTLGLLTVRKRRRSTSSGI